MRRTDGHLSYDELRARAANRLQGDVAGWWWADPLAALLIAVALAVEATRIAVRHRFG